MYGTQDFMGVNSLTNWKILLRQDLQVRALLLNWKSRTRQEQGNTQRQHSPESLNSWKTRKGAGGKTAKMNQDILKDSFDPDRNKETC